MDRQTNAVPVIIKRKRGSSRSGEQHGGAWKIAFADFATAMMAFFLVMWLVNATDETMRRGLAAYFSPTIELVQTTGGSDGFFGGHNVLSEAKLAASARHDTQLHAAGDAPSPPEQARDVPPAEAGTTDTLEELAMALRARGGESMVAELALRHIVTRVTDEGLIVEVFDLPDQPLFEDETDTPAPVLPIIAGMLGDVFGLVDNGIAVDGHLRALPVVRADHPAWALSTARAQSMRGLLQDAGLAPARMARVTGHADRSPVARNPAAVRNNRLEIVLLRDGTGPVRR